MYQEVVCTDSQDAGALDEDLPLIKRVIELPITSGGKICTITLLFIALPLAGQITVHITFPVL